MCVQDVEGVEDSRQNQVDQTLRNGQHSQDAASQALGLDPADWPHSTQLFRKVERATSDSTPRRGLATHLSGKPFFLLLLL